MMNANKICALFSLIFCFVILNTFGAKIEDTEKVSLRRSIRSASPSPTDCDLGQWAEWSSCFPCEGKKYRYRNLKQPAKFKGRVCSGYLWDVIICKPTEKCVQDNKCGLDFQCEETGRCIKRRLVCNGEHDCRDGSDEVNCQSEVDETFCMQLFPIPGTEKAVRGFNILTQEETQNVFDSNYFGGQCEYVYNGEWRELRYDPACEQMYYADDEKYFRKPYNFHVYQFLAHADTGMSSEIFDDTKELLKAVKQGSSSSFGFTFGISAAKSPVGVEFGIGTSKAQEFLKNITSYEEKNLSFLRILTKVQTARFRMRRKSIVLDEDVLQSLMELPDQYNYGIYAKFLNDYGTHFITSGTMGGKYEMIFVLDKEKMARNEVTATMVENCLKLSLGISLKLEDIPVEPKVAVETNNCKKKENEFEKPITGGGIINNVLSLVTGGDTGSTEGLSNVYTEDTYRFWGRSLKYNPAVIDFEYQPIYEILAQTDLTGMEKKRENLKKALDEFLNEFNSCRCGPCQYSGVPILNFNECSCKCSGGFEGNACEKTLRQGAPGDGYWSCWSSWTSCQSGKRQRTRECNNPPPKNGGAPCVGRSVHTEYC
ncbi:complement component C8 alpha chain [Bombina bombina]|uniref:complement component C8 alpha chain n=1 Tax=Bombina bombina TaxID=8345 RepID=UPI00235B148E|nr:complement component C8 alpha chain [Bombina bombina]